MPHVQWPAEPLRPRVQLTGIAYGPHDLGAKRPWYSRMWDFIAGDDETAYFVRPFSVAVRGSMIAVGDTEVGAVWLIDQASGDYERFYDIGGEPILAPVGLAFDAEGLFISDAERGVIDKVSFEGERIARFDDLSRPAGIAVGPGGRLAVAQPTAHKITVFEADGSRKDIGVQGSEPGEFNFPTQVAFMNDGSLLVNDALNFRIQHFGADLAYRGHFGERGDASGYIARSRGLAADEQSNVYVADALFDVVQVFGTTGDLHLVIGNDGAGPGEFWLPGGLAYHEGRLIVADVYNRRVQILRLTPESGG